MEFLKMKIKFKVVIDLFGMSYYNLENFMIWYGE